MKRLVIITFLLCTSIFCRSQKKSKEEINFNRFEAHRISLPQPQVKIKPVFPVTEIKVSDLRFDTSSVGLMQNTDNQYFSIVEFKKRTIDEIENYFRNSIEIQKQDSNSIEINCIIKKLILSDKIYVDTDISPSGDKKKYEIYEKSGLILLVEFYAKKNEIYTPLYRFDTTITGDKSIYTGGVLYLKNGLNASLRKLETLNWEKINNHGKKLSPSEINEYHTQRFSIPILLNEKIKGIYKSFEDFKNNNPQKTEFTIEKTKTGISLYIKNEKGVDILLTDLWGYCDGEEMYIFSAKNFFKLYPFGNTFRIYGAKDYTSYRTLRLNFGLLDAVMPNSTYAKSKTATKYDLILRLYQLDMDTGELY